MNQRYLCKFLFVALLCTVSLHAAEVESLRCEYRENPLGIDVVKPRLSWVIEVRGRRSEDRGQRQTAYQVLVASSEELLKQDKGDLWDSGKVESDQSIQVEYAGKPLTSRMHCHWRVRVWFLTSELRSPTSSAWSAPAHWSMGLLQPADWRAKWIGVKQPAPAPAGRVPLGPGPLRILSASYQPTSGAAGGDVTELLAAQVQDSTLLLTVGNQELGGDPAPGIEKKLVVEYELAGRRRTMTVAENGRLGLNLDNYVTEEAKWSRPGCLRKGFTLDGAVRRATVYATALGLYELRVNGQRVGDHLLAPEWTDYHARVQYQTYDVTPLLRSGANAIGASIGNGWYCGGWQYWEAKIRSMYGTDPSLLVQLEIEFTDGRRQTIVTDDSWRGTADGPLRFAGIYEGVTYDARKEMPGWDLPGFDDSNWRALQLRGVDLKVGKLVWPRGQPIRATRELKPVSVTEVRPGVHVFAFDQNMVGHCRFKLSGKAGETVELQHGEMRNPDGTVFLGNLLVVSSHRIQLDRYTFRSDGEETFEPAFTYHGFQYVEVRGLKEKPPLDSLVGVVVNSDCPETGEFTCSEPLLNRLAQNILWSQRGNYMGVPTDCPQRNERCGYTGDAQFFMRAAVYNMDVSAFFNKWLVDVCQDAQMPDGHIADRAPHYGTGESWYIGWGDAGIICPYEIYRTYGDTRVIREHYDAMKRYLEAMNRNSKAGLFTGNIGGGDWLETGGGVADDVMGTAYLALDTKLMADMAEAIGETSDAARFRARFDEVSAAFAKAYIDAEGNIKKSSQSGFALAFTIGLVPPALKEKMSARFAQEARRFDWHPRTGFVGTPRLLPGLHLAGRDEDAYKLLLTKTAPSWLYPVTVGATTIWEQWEAWDGKKAQGGMNSLNHYAFGSVGEYLFGMVGGIQAEAPGYKRIRIQPVIGQGLTWANTSYRSIHGKIVNNWKREGDQLTMEVTIPPNTTAIIHVPAKDAAAVTEGGNTIEKVKGVKFLRMENNAAVYDVGSGSYRFESMVAPVPSGSRVVPDSGTAANPSNRSAVKYRLEAKDQGVVYKHGNGPNRCDYLGARDVWVYEDTVTFYMFYDGSGPKGWLACLATSKDLVNWTPKGPVLDLGAAGTADSASASYGTTYFDGKTWHMFYLGTPNTSPGPDFIPAPPYLTMKAEGKSATGPWVKQPNIVPFRPSDVAATNYGASSLVVASPGMIVKTKGEYMMFFAGGGFALDGGGPYGHVSIARTKDLNGKWTVHPQPMLPWSETCENSRLYYEPSNKTWFLFTNLINRDHTDAVWVYWSKDLNKWDAKNKAVVLDGRNCTWSKACIGLPSVLKVGNRLAVFYDAPGGDIVGDRNGMNRDVGLAGVAAEDAGGEVISVT